MGFFFLLEDDSLPVPSVGMKGLPCIRLYYSYEYITSGEAKMWRSIYSLLQVLDYYFVYTIVHCNGDGFLPQIYVLPTLLVIFLSSTILVGLLFHF
jgi:hypothetical protein